MDSRWVTATVFESVSSAERKSLSWSIDQLSETVSDDELVTKPF